MGFPESVANEALTLCGRCCCICHKFCGTKIELHHIKQKAYGGEDILENCIPLCFDCHSDMGKADPKHPKGKRYSEAELKEHRDNWYKKVSGSSFCHSEEVDSTADKKLFKEISEVFTTSVRYWLAEADIGGSHPYHTFDSFVELLHKSDDPFFEFLNVEIEKLKGSLLGSIKDFLSYKAVNTFVRNIYGEDLCVTRQWMINHEDWTPHNMSYEEYSELYEEQAQKLNDLATAVWNSYCEFIRQSRRLLNL
ncbi:MAG: hypothetical protein PWQ08_1291 [Clostridiales bacterium]|jgi:hypothetical protein|nr:hypothetical protein [Clostridiales bacterium]